MSRRPRFFLIEGVKGAVAGWGGLGRLPAGGGGLSFGGGAGAAAAAGGSALKSSNLTTSFSLPNCTLLPFDIVLPPPPLGPDHLYNVYTAKHASPSTRYFRPSLRLSPPLPPASALTVLSSDGSLVRRLYSGGEGERLRLLFMVGEGGTFVGWAGPRWRWVAELRRWTWRGLSSGCGAVDMACRASRQGVSRSEAEVGGWRWALDVLVVECGG